MKVMGSEVVIPNLPAEHPSLWGSRVKNLCWRNINNSCSCKGHLLHKCNGVWRFRVKVYPLVPKPGSHHRKVLAINSYVRAYTKMSRAYWFPARVEEPCVLPQTLISPSPRDTDKILNCCAKHDYLVLTEVEAPSDPTGKSLFPTKDADTMGFKNSDVDILFSERDQPIEEPWLLHSSPLSQYRSPSPLETKSDKFMMTTEQHSESEGSTSQDLDSDSIEMKLSSQSLFNFDICDSSKSDIFGTFSMRNQPVEEPWLLQSSLSLRSDTEMVSSNNYVKGEPTSSELINQENPLQLPQVTENLLSEEESNTISQKEPVPTVILINSSVCTMQRIAVLEDRKLVELLLEPVKNNVLCDSVYLGVVTKLVPHMGGAFVNIGSSRPSLMDIKHDREPFIFPPFRHLKEKEGNGYAFTVPEEQSCANQIEGSEINDYSGQYMHVECADHDTEDDDVDIESLNENVNGSMNGHCEVEVNSNVFSDKFDTEGSVDSGSPSYPHFMETDREDACASKNRWGQVRKGTKVVVQVVKEGLGTKGPTLTAYPKLRSRFWVLSTRCNTIGISKKICGVERTRLRVIAKTLQPQGFGLTVRTVAAGRLLDELRKDLERLLSTWKDIMKHAKAAALAADEGIDGALPLILHRAMGQTLSVVQDYFSEKVNSMVVDSTRTYHEVTNYLQKIAPDLCDRVELYNKRTPLFDEYSIEEEISNLLHKWVSLANGGYLVIEQTEALVSIDVNGGQCMLSEGTSQEKAILEVNLAAAKQIARELRLRDIGGIIVVDFIDMVDDANKRLVYEEVKKAVERDRSTVKVSELSRNGIMEITRKRVRPSVTFMISEPCTCCHGIGRVEALETLFSKIEREICRLLAMVNMKANLEDPNSWPSFVLRVDRFMCNYLTSGKQTRIAVLSSSLKVWILLKVARGFTRGEFEVKPITSEEDDSSQKQVAVNMLFPIKKWKTGEK